MNDMLREDLHALAEQAPTVDLAARAVRGARRRRTTRLAVLTGAVLTCLAVVGGGVVSAWLRPAPPIVMAPPETKVLPLPADGVEPVQYAYRAACSSDPCGKTPWRIVTNQGDTYRLGDDLAGPLQVTADGRRIAYYSTKHGRIVVRDLASGKTWRSPLKQPEEDFEVEYALRSDSGRDFVAQLTLTNTGTRELRDWAMSFTFPGQQSVTKATPAVHQDGRTVRVVPTAGRNALAPGASEKVALSGRYTGGNPLPVEFKLGDATCGVRVSGVAGTAPAPKVPAKAPAKSTAKVSSGSGGSGSSGSSKAKSSKAKGSGEGKGKGGK